MSMSADEVRLPSPEAIASAARRELSELDRLALLDRLVAEHAAEAQAYVGDLHRLRRATIRDIVDRGTWDGEAAHRRRARVDAVAARLGISVTQVYRAIRAAVPGHRVPVIVQVRAQYGRPDVSRPGDFRHVTMEP